MISKRAIWIWGCTIVCAWILSAGCEESSGPSGPGELTVALSTSGPTGAAFLITLRGNEISDPVAVRGDHVIYSADPGNTVNVVTVGAIASGNLLRFSVPDVAQLSSYSAELVQVAGPDNELLDPAVFTLTVTH